MIWILGAAAIYAGLLAFLWVFQRQMLYFPDTSTPDPAAYGWGSAEVLTSTGEDGQKVSGWLMPPAVAEAPVIALFHGNAGNLGLRALKFRFFVERGYGLYLAGYRGYGGEAGSPSEAGLLADARAQLAALEAHGLNPRHLILYGESLGTGVATAMAAEGWGRALILEAPYTSIAEAAQRRFPILPVAPLVRDRFDSLSRIGHLDIPVMILHGHRDITVPFGLGRKLFEAANEPKHAYFPVPAGHNSLYDHGAGRAVFDFLARYGLAAEASR